MSIRLRLTLVYSFILALMLAGFGVAVYATLERTTTAALEDALGEQARVARGPREGPFGRIGPGQSPFGAPVTFTQLRDANGNVIARSDNLRGADITLPLEPSDLGRLRADGGVPIEYIRID